jgi:hypothetical protein
VLRIVGCELDVGFCFANCDRAGLSVDGAARPATATSLESQEYM